MNNDLISRKQAIEVVQNRHMMLSKEKVLLINDLEKLPSAQPEIIRCKDCKYAEYIDDVQTLWCTECGQGRTVAPDDFCSYADRREETT